MSTAITLSAEEEIEVRLNRARVLRMIYEGKSDEEGSRLLEVKIDEYQKLKEEAVRAEGKRVESTSAGEVYAEYLIQMRRLIHELLDVRKRAKDANVFGAQVDALKTAGMLLDKSIARGQELGIISTATKKVEHLHAHLVSKLDNRGLRATIIHEVRAMEGLVGESADKGFLELGAGDVIDVEALSIDDAPADEATPGTVKRGALGNDGEAGRPGFARGGANKAAAARASHRKKDKRDEIDSILEG